MLATATVTLWLACAVSGSRLRWRELSAQEKHRYTYADFVVEFDKEASAGSEAIFTGRLAAVHEHNACGLWLWCLLRDGGSFFCFYCTSSRE